MAASCSHWFPLPTEPAEPKIPTVPTLKSRSMRAVARARHALSAKYQYLDMLPQSLLDEMMVAPETRAMRGDPEGLRLLLSPLSPCLSVHVFVLPCDFTEFKFVEYASRQVDSCKSKLDAIENFLLSSANIATGITKLEMDVNANDSQVGWLGKLTLEMLLHAFLNRLLEGLSDLHEVSVVPRWSDMVSDLTLDILGQRHKNLERLVCCTAAKGRAWFEEVFSSHGLCRLLSECPQLEELKVLTGLDNAEDSQHSDLALRCPHNPMVMLAVQEYASQTPSPPPLKLKQPFYVVPAISPPQSREEIVRFFSVLPNVTYVAMYKGSEESCTGLAETSNGFETLWLELTGPLSFDTQRRLMAKVAPTLKFLYINGASKDHEASNIDLGVIAQHCLGLEHLHIKAEMVDVEEDFVVTEEQFAKLITCHVQHEPSPGRETVSLPLGLLWRLYAQCKSSVTLLRLRAADHIFMDVLGGCQGAAGDTAGTPEGRHREQSAIMASMKLVSRTQGTEGCSWCTEARHPDRIDPEPSATPTPQAGWRKARRRKNKKKQ